MPILLLTPKFSMQMLQMAESKRSLVVTLLALTKTRLEVSPLTPQDEAPIVKRGVLLVA